MLKNTILLAGVAVGLASMVACSDDESTSASSQPEGACSLVATEGEGIEIKCGGEVYGNIVESADSVYGASCTAEALKDDSGYNIICAGKTVGTVYNGAHGRNGTPGSTGPAGSSCTAQKDEKTSAVTITCGAEEYVIERGEKGDKGDKGADGDDCTVSSTGLVTCGKTTFQLKAGENCSVDTEGLVTCGTTTFQLKKGEDGDDCSVSSTGLVTCGEDEYQLTNGTSCSVKENLDGSATVSCTDGTSATIAKGAAGTSCSADYDDDDNVIITCGTKQYTIPKGVKGDDCSVSASGLVTCGSTTFQIKNGVDGDDCSVSNTGLVTCGTGTSKTTFQLKNGEDGDDCSVNTDGLVTCGTTTFQLKKGADGNSCFISEDVESGKSYVSCEGSDQRVEVGKGADGASCAVIGDPTTDASGNTVVDIKCGTAAVVPVTIAKGTDGASCAVSGDPTTDASGNTVVNIKCGTADAVPVTIAKGDAGASRGCTATRDDANHRTAITCEAADGTESTSYVYDGGYAVCGTAVYNTTTQECSCTGSTCSVTNLEPCGTKYYNPATQICFDGVGTYDWTPDEDNPHPSAGVYDKSDYAVCYANDNVTSCGIYSLEKGEDGTPYYSCAPDEEGDNTKCIIEYNT